MCAYQVGGPIRVNGSLTPRAGPALLEAKWKLLQLLISAFA